MPIIIPAILTNDLADYQNKLALVNDLVSDLQIDISDRQFVQSQTIALKDLVDIGRKPKTEIHLMVNQPENYLDDCRAAVAETVLFHWEAVSRPAQDPSVPSLPQDDIGRIIKLARAKGLRVGLVLNPETPIEVVLPFDNQVDIVQLMGVHPGFYGRSFIPETLDRLRQLRAKLRRAMLEVDGGVNLGNIAEVAATGVERIVVGSAIFNAPDPSAAYRSLVDQLLVFSVHKIQSSKS